MKNSFLPEKLQVDKIKTTHPAIKVVIRTFHNAFSTIIRKVSSPTQTPQCHSIQIQTMFSELKYRLPRGLDNQKLNNVVRGVDTYWLSKPLRTVFNHKHSLYLDGGTEDLRWGADFSYNSGEGVMKGSYRDRMAGGLSLSYRLGAFQVRNYFSYTYTKSQESPYGSFSDYTSKLPYDEYIDENGRYLETTYPWTGGSGEV